MTAAAPLAKVGVMRKIGDRAVVIGASVGGLLAARVLADACSSRVATGPFVDRSERVEGLLLDHLQRVTATATATA